LLCGTDLFFAASVYVTFLLVVASDFPLLVTELISVVTLLTVFSAPFIYPVIEGPKRFPNSSKN